MCPLCIQDGLAEASHFSSVIENMQSARSEFRHYSSFSLCLLQPCHPDEWLVASVRDLGRCGVHVDQPALRLGVGQRQGRPQLLRQVSCPGTRSNKAESEKDMCNCGTFSHLNKTTTFEDPRKWGTVEPEETPEPRSVTLNRDSELGFGFVAGSEKPVIVR